MRAYSTNVRERILYAVDQGKPRAEIIEMFHVSRATIKRYPKLRHETGELKAKTIPGRPAKKGATLAEHCHIWETAQGVPVSSATMSRAIQRLNWTRKKKTLRASEQKEEARAAWGQQAQTLDAEK